MVLDNTAALLDATLKAAGIPIISVKVGDPANRATWSVLYDPAATQPQKDQGASILSTFSATDPTVLSADLDRTAAAQASSLIVKALCAEILEVKLGRPLVAGDIPAVQAMFARVVAYYKFVVTNGL